MLLSKLKRALVAHALIPPGSHVLVAVSGGADSTALLYALHELAGDLDIRLSCAHLNHLIRGKAAASDAAFVQAMAGNLGVPCSVGRSDVPRRAKRKGISIEMAAREARYDFLRRVAHRINANLVVTAHTADDQAETMLLNIARGAGPAGLSGIPRDTVIKGLHLVRPMLDMTRRDILEFLIKSDIPWCEDETNLDSLYLRNRVRHEILPLLRGKLNPSISQTLARTAEVMREENEFLDKLAEAALKRCRNTDGSLDVGKLKPEPLVLKRRVIQAWLIAAGVTGDQLNFETIGRVNSLVLKRSNRSVNLGGHRYARRRYDKLLLDTDTDLTSEFRVKINIPGETLLPGQGLLIKTSVEPGLKKDNKKEPGKLPACASIRLSAVHGRHLYARSWQSGDRMQPLGMNGSKKVQDIFVDSKINLENRHRIPLLECGGEIIWLPGYQIARGYEVRNPDHKAIHVEIEHIV